MNFRLTAILFGTILLLGVVLLIQSCTVDDRPPTDLLLEELAGTKADQVDAVEVEREGGRLRLERVKDSPADAARWRVVEPYAAKADAGAVSEVVAALLRAKPVAHPELTGNPALHGLQPPGLRVTLRHGERASTVNLGNVSTGGNRGVVYVTTSARPDRPMAAPRAAFDALFRETDKSGKAVDFAKWVGDYRAKSVFPADARGAGDDVVGVTVGAKGKTLSLARSPGGGWKFVSPKDWGDADPSGDPAAAPGTFTGVSRLLGALTGLQASGAGDFVENPTPQDLEKYGLNEGNPDRVRVELLTKDGEKTVAYVGKKVEAPAAPAGMPAADRWWVKVEGQPGVIRAGGGDVAGLAALVENPDPLRDRTLLALDKSGVDGLDLGPAKLRKAGTGPAAQWKLYGNPSAGDPQAANQAEVDRVLSALTERRTVKSFPGPVPAAFGPNDPVVRVWSRGFGPAPDPKAEPKEQGKPVTLTFATTGKREPGTVTVKRVSADEKSTDYFVLPEKVKVGAGPEVDLVAAVTKTRLDLLDRDLKGFAASNANKLTVAGAVAFELDRVDEKADPSAGRPVVWRFAADAKGPAGQVYRKGDAADAQTVQGLLDVLATTPTFTRAVDETPSAEKLAGYGLGPAPKLRVGVGLKDTAPEEKERVYEFGNDFSATEVYARQAGRPVVFTLPKFVLERFTTADLRDRAIFRVDPAQVSTVRITGWGGLFGEPKTMVYGKNKDGAWEVVEGPTKYPVDQGKMKAFLDAISNARVKTFTADQAEVRLKFNDPKVLFDVVLADPAGAHHLYLRLGGPVDAGGTEAYALTNRLPGGQNVVVVDATPFKGYREAPGAFAK